MDSIFKVHILNEEGLRKADNVAHYFDKLLSDVSAEVPEGRELALVRTKLQEAAFFAKRGIALQKENQAD